MGRRWCWILRRFESAQHLSLSAIAGEAFEGEAGSFQSSADGPRDAIGRGDGIGGGGASDSSQKRRFPHLRVS